MIDWLDKLQKQFSGFDEKENFQVINMNHKLKSIQKRKHKNNFKNIESFSVLKNENTDKKQNKKVVKKKKLKPFDKMSSIFTNDTENLSDKKGTIENFVFDNNSSDNENTVEEDEEETDNVIRNKDDIDLNDKSNTKTWEGQGKDDPNADPLSLEKVKKQLRDGINETYDYIFSFQRNLADVITDTLSNNNANEQDRELIRDFLSSIICAFISIPITYNWFFIQYYSLDHSELKIPHVTMDGLKKLAKEDDNMWLFMYFFEFAMWIPTNLDYYLTDFIPNYTMEYFDGKLNFILVFFSVYYFVKNHTETLKNVFIDLLSENSENGILTFLFTLIILVYLKKIPPSDPFEILYAYMNPFTFFINVIIRFIITLLIAVPVGALLSVIYLYTYTIGSIPLFSKYGYFKSIEEINQYIKDKKSTFEIRTCEDETFFQRMIKSFMRLLGLFQDYLLPLILFYILISYTNKIRNKLSNVEGMFGNFKLSFVIMNIVLIVSLGSLLYPAFSEKFSYFIRSENK